MVVVGETGGWEEEGGPAVGRVEPERTGNGAKREDTKEGGERAALQYPTPDNASTISRFARRAIPIVRQVIGSFLERKELSLAIYVYIHLIHLKIVSDTFDRMYVGREANRLTKQVSS